MLDEIKTFIAVVEYRNFTKAAQAINLSQPSVSLHIKHLEEYFNSILIKRSIKNKSIIVTEQGRLLYDRGKQLLKLIEDTKIDIKNFENTIKGKLRIGASLTIGEYFLPSFLGKFAKEYPQLDLEITIENTSSICEKVRNFQLDLGLIEGTVPFSDFLYKSFYKDQMVLATPYESELVGLEFSAENFNNYTWISREEGSGTRDYLNLFLTSNNIIPKNIIVFGSNYAVKEAVKNNLGLTFISNKVVENSVKEKEISIVETDSKYVRYYSYILPKNSFISKATKAFIEMLNTEK